KGRQLKKMVKGTTTIEYAYDVAGLRIQKKVNGVATDYTLHGKLVIALKQGDDTLHFFYDAQSRPAMLKYGEVHYSYQHNLQGDIIAILDATGAKVVEYAYDAWGRPTCTTGSMAETLGKLNPFRYRHYVYDEETAYYYLRTRYYNPEWNRFINEDILIGAGGLLSHNVFAYCANNAIAHSDSNGCAFHHSFSRFWPSLKFFKTKEILEVVKPYMSGKQLHVGEKAYNLAVPPKLSSGPMFTNKPKTIATGKGSSSYSDNRALLTNFGEYDMESVGMLSLFANSIVSVNVTVSIQQTGEDEPLAFVNLEFSKSYTDMVLGVDPVQKRISTGPIRVIGNDSGNFTVYLGENREVDIADKDGAIQRAIESVVWE
ncbi:RHS repeat-associated core domain-containing protein, partial [Eubacteriales bacterium OttesenSCG-928-N13]|nr:RHS repeat-associated core domain-containing protein [Eubacteriales bacterium OttesenSCG-928-N13]